MRKFLKPSRKSQKTKGINASPSAGGQMGEGMLERRKFIKTAGLTAAAMAVAPKPLKAMMNTNRGWLQAVELSRLTDTDCPAFGIYSADVSWFQPQQCDLWCWAATAFNLFIYYSDYSAGCQCSIVDWTINSSGFCSTALPNECCPNSCTGCQSGGCDGICNNGCDRTGSFEQAYYGTSDPSSDCLDMTFDAVACYLSSNYCAPVVAAIGACGSGMAGTGGDPNGCTWNYCGDNDPCSPYETDFGHYVIIFGYFIEEDPYEIGFFVWDPWHSDGISSVVVEDGGGSYNWVHSLHATDGMNFSNANWWGAMGS